MGDNTHEEQQDKSTSNTMKNKLVSVPQVRNQFKVLIMKKLGV